MKVCFVKGNGNFDELVADFKNGLSADVLILFSGFYYSQSMANLQVVAKSSNVRIDNLLGRGGTQVKSELINSLNDEFSKWWAFIDKIRKDGTTVLIYDDPIEVYTKDGSTLPVKDKVFTLSGRFNRKKKESTICGRMISPRNVSLVSEITPYSWPDGSGIVFWPMTACYQDSFNFKGNDFVVINDKSLSKVEFEQLVGAKVIFTTRRIKFKTSIPIIYIKTGITHINL